MKRHFLQFVAAAIVIALAPSVNAQRAGQSITVQHGVVKGGRQNEAALQ